MESRWRRGGDELCHRCLSAAAVWSTVGLRIRSIIGSRGECAALTRRCPGRAGVGSEEREKNKDSVFTNRAGRRKQCTVHADTQTPVNPRSACFLARAHTSSQASSATT